MKAIAAAALALALASCAGASGPKGNDTGGIIPWSPENARVAHYIAADNCAAYGKAAVIGSVQPHYGGMIGYVCRRPRG